MATRFMNGVTSKDFSQSFFNIDMVANMFVETQKTLGQTPIFKESERSLAMKTHPLETTNVKYKPKEKVDENCDSCVKSCSKHRFLSTFDESDDEFISDDDELYLCEYCSSLGYNKKYMPETCDTCTKCECCAEYEDGDCDGCGYSTALDGRYYREKIAESELFSDDELEKFRSIDPDKKEQEPFMMKGYFTLAGRY